MTQKRKPCAECPFSRAVEPGGTGGSDPAIYVGQAYGPFLLPCHMDPNYHIDRRSPRLLQCAGAAAFRNNIGVSELMPQALLYLEKDEDLVFASPAELIAHHREVSLEEAKAFLEVYPPEVLLALQFRSSGVKRVQVPRSNNDHTT